jgi:hypothetical protein
VHPPAAIPTAIAVQQQQQLQLVVVVSGESSPITVLKNARSIAKPDELLTVFFCVESTEHPVDQQLFHYDGF